MKWHKWINIVTTGLLLISVAMNVILTQRIKSSQYRIEALTGRGHLAPGTRVPDIDGKRPDGTPLTLEFAKTGKPTILYLFSPLCHWCNRNFDNMMALYHATKNQYVFVGVSLSPNGVKDYVQSHAIDYPVVMDISTSLRQTYKFSATPTTIVVSTDNVVIKEWSGAYDGAVHKEVEGYFKTKLPGLAVEGKTLAKN